MKAVILEKIGRLEFLKYKDIPIPKITVNETLIEVKYCGINHLDLHLVKGVRKGPDKLPHILGSEIVGKVAKITNKSSGFKINDSVVVYPWLYCGKCIFCRSGKENLCIIRGIIGGTRWGGFAQYIAVPIVNLIKLPIRIDLKKVCASCLSGTTAYHLSRRTEIKPNSKILITGASGGVGTILFQLLKRHTSSIYCTSSNRKKYRQLKNLGVLGIFSANNFKKEVKKLIPEGFDIVFDLMGGKIWSNAIDVLATGGALVFCATSLYGSGELNIASAFSRQLSLLGTYGGSITDLKQVVKLIEKGNFSPCVDSVYPLIDINHALLKLDRKGVFGKILIEI